MILFGITPSTKANDGPSLAFSVIDSILCIFNFNEGFLFLPLPYMLFISLQNISLPEWTTLNMISPILGSILAILFLGEKINYATTTAIFIGFIGVIFIIQPGFQDFSFYYLFPVYGAFTLALQYFF